MANFYVSKNPDLRVPPNPRLIEWLNILPDNYHAFIGVIGTDFKADCILIKSQGILNVCLDPADYRVATKEGAWTLRDSSEIVNPISMLEDSADKIRDFLISVSDKIFPELKKDPQRAKEFAKKLKVLWVVALTHPYPKGAHPSTSGRIFYNQTGFTNLAKSWLSPMPWDMGFTSSVVSQLANILGLEAISASQLGSLRTSRKPLTRNPYHFTGEVLAAKFRGRSREISVAKSCLSQNPSTPVALVGLQRTGKSSLGAEVIRQLLKEDPNLRIISYVLGEFDPNGECADIAGFRAHGSFGTV